MIIISFVEIIETWCNKLFDDFMKFKMLKFAGYKFPFVFPFCRPFCLTRWFSLIILKTIYHKVFIFHFSLVIISRWPLLSSKVKVPDCWNGFCWLSWKPFITKTSYFTCRLVMTSRWSLLILGSLGQRSRSQWPWMLKWFPLIILKTIHHKVFIFHM